MNISDEDIKGITSAAWLDQSIKECLDCLKAVNESEAEIGQLKATIEIKKAEMLATLAHLQGLRMALRVRTGL